MKDQDLQIVLSRLSELESRILALTALLADYYAYHTTSDMNAVLKQADQYLNQARSLQKAHPQGIVQLPFSTLQQESES